VGWLNVEGSFNPDVAAVPITHHGETAIIPTNGPDRADEYRLKYDVPDPSRTVIGVVLC
jgi:hypothetical protein